MVIILEISFLIPTRNRPENLKKSLLSISKLNIQNLNSEIIVLDDCSELSYDSVLSEFENIQYYKILLPWGFLMYETNWHYMPKENI